VTPESQNKPLLDDTSLKHVLKVTQSTMGHPLLGSKSPNTDSLGNEYSRNNERMTTNGSYLGRLKL
jgi:hypothetical protein